ncbi:MAG TPA: MFS transporter [Acidimicrobiales bacterium]|nr:MFS transporter [Acidimicrobiales bacterium]
MTDRQVEGSSERARRFHRPSSLSSFAYRNFTMYFFGQMISIAGSWMQSVAQAFLVLHLTGSGTDLGLLMAIRTLPMLLLGPVGGLVVDRFSRIKMLYFTNTASGALCGVLAWVVIDGRANILLIDLMALGLGLIQVVDNPARQVILSDLVPISELSNAVSLNSVMINAGRVIGPGFAGLVIAGFGVGTCFAVNALSFVVVLITLAFIRVQDLEVAIHPVRERGQIRAGLRHVLDRSELLVPLLLLIVAGTLTWEFQVTIPLIAQKTFNGNGNTYGTLFACVGIGAVIGGLVTAARPQATYRGLAYAAIGWGATCVLAGASPSLMLEYPAMVLVGYGSVSFNAISKTKMQMAAAPSMRGRVMALWSVAWVGSTPIGGPVVGYVGQHLGPRWSWYISGVPLAVAGLISLPYLIRIDAKSETDKLDFTDEVVRPIDVGEKP